MVKNRLILSIVTASLCLFIQSPLHADVYKWVDENGQVHYGEKPGNTAAEEVTIRHNETTTPRKINKAEGTDGEKTEQADKDAGTEAGEQEEWGEWKEVPPSSSEKRKLCNQAKSDLAAISGRGRMREINSKGEYVYLTEAQRQQRISAAKNKKKKMAIIYSCFINRNNRSVSIK